MKILAIIQARMGSTRLPEKIMKKLQGETVLFHVVDRLKKSSHLTDIAIATTILEIDKVIVDEAKRLGVKCFRGSEDDVLSRYYETAKAFQADVIVRITSDCPLIDYAVVDQMIETYLHSNVDIVSNAGSDPNKRTFPRGLDAEVFGFSALETAYMNAREGYMREHVTPYLYENGQSKAVLNESDESIYRWTLDTEEDFELIQEIYNRLFVPGQYFGFRDVLALIKANPELSLINAHIEQKKLK